MKEHNCTVLHTYILGNAVHGITARIEQIIIDDHTRQQTMNARFLIGKELENVYTKIVKFRNTQ